MTHATLSNDFTVYVNGKAITTTVTAYGAKDDNDDWYVNDVEYSIGHESDDGDYLSTEERSEMAELLEDQIRDYDWEFNNYTDEQDYPEFSDEAV